MFLQHRTLAIDNGAVARQYRCTDIAQPCSVADCPQAPFLRHCLSRMRIRSRSKRRDPDCTEKDLPGLVVERSTTWRLRAQGAGAGQMHINVPRRIFWTLRIVGGLPTALMQTEICIERAGFRRNNKQ